MKYCDIKLDDNLFFLALDEDIKNVIWMRECLSVCEREREIWQWIIIIYVYKYLISMRLCEMIVKIVTFGREMAKLIFLSLSRMKNVLSKDEMLWRDGLLNGMRNLSIYSLHIPLLRPSHHHQHIIISCKGHKINFHLFPLSLSLYFIIKII